MSETLALNIQHEIQLRFLCPQDIPEVKLLCADWFPIDYPDSWFEDITSNRKFYSLAATYHSQIIGIIVAEVKTRSRCNREDADILSSHFPPSSQMAYILSLGVAQDFRRNGIASLLLDSLLSYLTAAEQHNCKAIYLHVLTCNTAAIRFYERQKFRMHSFLPYYYSIKGTPRDGYSYVLYVNGGQPPWTVFDFIKHIGMMMLTFQPCQLPQRLIASVHSLWRRIIKGAPSLPSEPHIS